MQGIKPLQEGFKEAFDWYKNNSDKVNKKPFWDYIDKYLS